MARTRKTIHPEFKNFRPKAVRISDAELEKLKKTIAGRTVYDFGTLVDVETGAMVAIQKHTAPDNEVIFYILVPEEVKDNVQN